MQVKIIQTIEGHENYSITSDGEVISNKKGKILIQSITNGYKQVSLYTNKKRKEVLVHQLLAKAFIPNPNNLPMVDHIDRNRSNNDLENLRWVTHVQNGRNITKRKGTSSKYIGVCQRKGSKKFTAQITANGKPLYLKSHETEEAAAMAYNNAAVKLGYLTLNIIHK